MTELLTGLADARQRLLERTDQLAAIWNQAQAATGRETPGTGLISADLGQVRADLERRRFTIGLFGLIKRGKSTLLNALLGSELSPTHVTPETAVPVYVDHGDETTATVHFATGETRRIDPATISQWVSQKHDPRNELGVTHARWRLPSPLLRNGVRLVDTPGLDDADADELYTRRTIQELDAADVGILVFLSPPTVSATEVAFLRDVTGAQLRKTLLVANLYPQQYHDPEARSQVVEYVRERVADAVGSDDVRIHPVCAEEAWQARERGDTAAFQDAGGAALLAAVEATIADNTGRRALQRAEDALDKLSQVAGAAIDLQVQALSGALGTDERERLEVHRQQLVDKGDDLLEQRLGGIAGIRAHLDAMINTVFLRTRAAVQEARSVDELDGILRHATREIEVVSEDAFRNVQARLMAIHAESARELDAGVEATLHEPGAVLPGMRGVREDDTAIAEATALLDHTALQGAAVGGLIAGGAGFMLVGSLLGPFGLVAGALVGWRVGGILRTGRELRPLRDELDERLSVVADAVIAELDRRVDDLVAAVRATTTQRRLGFVADLGDVVDVLDRLDSDERADALATLQELSTRLRQLGEDPDTSTAKVAAPVG